jgi:putative endonuclease
VQPKNRSNLGGASLFMSKQFYIYLLTNQKNTVLYTGFTNNIIKRVWEHKQHIVKGFTKKYNVNKLVYYEIFEDMYSALEREKQIKAGSRQKKIDLINKINLSWEDLYSRLLE